MEAPRGQDVCPTSASHLAVPTLAKFLSLFCFPYHISQGSPRNRTNKMGIMETSQIQNLQSQCPSLNPKAGTQLWNQEELMFQFKGPPAEFSYSGEGQPFFFFSFSVQTMN